MMVRGAADMSTPLPSSLALAATFNPDIAFSGGQMVGVEARAKRYQRHARRRRKSRP